MALNRLNSMDKYSANLSRLKDLLQTADNFGDIVTYFFDHLTNDPVFVHRSKPVKHPLVQQALQTVAAELFKRDAAAAGTIEDAQITNMVLLKLSKYPFYHGACFIRGRPVNILYFEDIDMGIVCTTATYPYMQFARFTCYRTKGVDQDSIFTAGDHRIH
jgi:hypothetical protein